MNINKSIVVPIALLLNSYLGATAFAASSFSLLPPEYTTIDENRVDFASTGVSMVVTDVSIGPESRKLQNSVTVKNGHDWGDIEFKSDMLDVGTWPISNADDTTGPYCQHYDAANPYGKYEFKRGYSRDQFCFANGTYVSFRGSGATLDVGPTTLTYTNKSGDKYSYGRVEFANGLVNTSYYRNAVWSSATSGQVAVSRVEGIVRNDGYALIFKYAANGAPTDATIADWYRSTGTTAVNLAADACDFTTFTCSSTTSSLSSSFFSATLPNGNNTYTFQNHLGQSWRFTTGPAGPLGNARLILAYKSPTRAC